MEKVVLVTGSAKGIGLAIARMALDQGWSVALMDSDGPELELSAKALEPADRVFSFSGDVSLKGDTGKFVLDASERFGRIDALVNNAAAIGSSDWDRVLAVNLTGPWNLCCAAEPFLRASGGSIVNIASTRALMSEPGTEPYSASKGGLLALTHALAVGWGPDIRVNAVSPGWINSREEVLSPADHSQHPVGRVGRPDDVASMVLYLISGEAGFITGQNFIVDGGMTRKMIYV